MPTLNSEYYANQIGGQVRYRAASNVACGEVRTTTLEYKFVGTEASGDILKLGRLDPGITVHADEIKVFSEGIGGTTVTFTALGDQQTANRYTTTAVALTAAGYVVVTPVPATTIPEVAITKDTNDVIQGTLGGTLPATAGKRIWVRIRWRPAS
jgi:uncharacterized membrane protein